MQRCSKKAYAMCPYRHLNELTKGHSIKRDIALAKAHAEVDAINREHEAYIDGIYDAVKVIKNRYEKEQKDGK